MTQDQIIDTRKFCIQIATAKIMAPADQPKSIIAYAEEIYNWITREKPDQQ